MQREARLSDKPNILFIMADQWRGDCLSVAGHPVVETPRLDDLARSGTLFTRAYSTCPSCIAARASIFTGLTPSAHGRLGYRDHEDWRYDDMLPAVLSQAGYQTHCVGKTHFWPRRARCGFQSMEVYSGCEHSDPDKVDDYFQWLQERTDGRLTPGGHGLTSNGWMARPSHLPEELHNNTWIGERGIDFLRRRDPSRPFFLFLSFPRPHAPLDPPQTYWDLYRDRGIPPAPIGDWAGEHDVPVSHVDAWHGHLSDHLLARARRAYYAQMSAIDHQIGRVLDTVRQTGAGESTAVVFTSDHGELLGDHHLFRKCLPYEGSARVPLIVRSPHGAVRSGGVGKTAASEPDPAASVEAPVALEDLYPTLLEIAGVPVPERTEGVSALHLGAREYLHGEHSANYFDDGVQYLTDGREKYIWYTKSGREQFFDLTDDPDELHDLAADPGSLAAPRRPPDSASHRGDNHARERVELWRLRLIDELAKRPKDGMSDGSRLISGKLLPASRGNT